jgi:hypothetical protein
MLQAIQAMHRRRTSLSLPMEDALDRRDRREFRRPSYLRKYSGSQSSNEGSEMFARLTDRSSCLVAHALSKGIERSHTPSPDIRRWQGHGNVGEDCHRLTKQRKNEGEVLCARV